MSPTDPPREIAALPERDSMPVVIPTVIPMIPSGIMTSNAPKKGINRTLSGRASAIPTNPPRIMLGCGSKDTTQATRLPENAPMKKSAIFKFISAVFSLKISSFLSQRQITTTICARESVDHYRRRVSA